MNTGDADTIAAVSHGDEASLKLLVSVARTNGAYNRLEEAAAKRFGDPKSVFAYPRAKDHYGRLQTEIDTLEEQVQGSTATLGKGLASVQLTKVDGQWKVDRARHAPPESISASAIAMSDALAGAYSEVANGIAAGAYSTPEEAKAVLMGKTQQAVMALSQTREQPDALATQPATMPATKP